MIGSNNGFANRPKRLLSVAALLIAVSTGGFAQGAAPVDTAPVDTAPVDTAAVSIEEAKVAQDAAAAWLALIDSTDYRESWQQAAPWFQEQLSEEAWEQALESTLGPLGPLLSRAPQDREYTTTLPKAPEGEYVIVTYESSYIQLEAAVETVTMMKTDDGTWRVVGYLVQPAS